jgi:hypothetical protein
MMRNTTSVSLIPFAAHVLIGFVPCALAAQLPVRRDSATVDGPDGSYP